MRVFNQINNYLSDLGITLAGIMVSLLAVVLMLFPGVVFAYFLIKVVWFFIGSQDFIPPSKLLLYTILGVASWYIGVGVSKINKPPERDNKKYN